MEQILPNGTILVQAAIFLVALWVIKAFILTPISRVLEERRNRIEGAAAEAARFEEESGRLDKGYKEKIAGARSRAQQERARRREEALREEREILEAARKEAQGVLERIRDEIQRETQEARGRLRQEAEGLSRLVTEKILGRPVT